MLRLSPEDAQKVYAQSSESDRSGISNAAKNLGGIARGDEEIGANEEPIPEVHACNYEHFQRIIFGTYPDTVNRW